MQPMLVQCPKCQARLKVSITGNKKILCPKCRTPFSLAAPEPVEPFVDAIIEDSPEVPSLPVRVNRQRTQPRARTASQGVETWKIAAVTGGLATVALIVVVIVVYSQKQPVAEVAFQDTPFTVPVQPATPPPARSSAPATGVAPLVTLPDLKPNQEYVDQLEPEAAIPNNPDFVMRLPKGFSVFQSGSGSVGMTIFEGPRLADGSKATLSMLTLSMPAGLPVTREFLEATWATRAQSERNMHQNWSQDLQVLARSNGLTCLHARWSGLSNMSKQVEYGTVFIAATGGKVFHFAFDSGIPILENPVAQQLEAAFSTLRRVSGH